MPPRSTAEKRSDRPSDDSPEKPAKKPTKAAPAKAARAAAGKGAKAAVKPKSATKPKPTKAQPAMAEAASVLKLRALIDEVAEVSGTARATARHLVEATLDAIGAALDRGDTLNLPPLGRLRVTKARGADQGASLTLRLRRPGEAAAEKNADSGRYEDLAVTDE